MKKDMDMGMDRDVDTGGRPDGRRKSLVKKLSRGAGRQGLDGTGAFYIETLVLLAVFTIVTVVLVRAFVLSRELSAEAGVLTKAVHLAENAAEAVAASDSGEMLFALLNEAGNVQVLEGTDQASGRIYRAAYDADGKPDAGGVFWVEVSWVQKEGGLVESEVKVYWEDVTDPVYTLETAVFVHP